MTALSSKRRTTVSHRLRIWQQDPFRGFAVLRRNMQSAPPAAFQRDISGRKQIGAATLRGRRSDAPQIDSAVFSGADFAEHV
jgi:hypothetical protein